jgi:hypothetical protein
MYKQTRYKVSVFVFGALYHINRRRGERHLFFKCWRLCENKKQNHDPSTFGLDGGNLATFGCGRCERVPTVIEANIYRLD